MKNLFVFVAAVFFVMSSAIAASPSLYNDLNVPELDVRPVMNGAPVGGVEMLAKEVAGIRCVRTTNTYSGARKHDCFLSVERYDAAILYNALTTRESNGAIDNFGKPIEGTRILVKNAVSLLCRKISSTAVGSQSNYDCEVRF